MSAVLQALYSNAAVTGASFTVNPNSTTRESGQIARFVLLKVCHSEPVRFAQGKLRGDSALIRLRPELQIVREVYPERSNCRPFASLRVTAKGSRSFISLGGALAHDRVEWKSR